MSANVKNMTSGSPGKLILLFALPLMVGNVFQQFYTMVDAMVVGQVVGVEALAAIGAADWLIWMIQGILTGGTQGFSILAAQNYGAGDRGALKKTVAMSYLLTAVTALAVLAVSQLAVRPVLQFLNTPEDVIGMSITYVRIVFGGIPVIAAYNCLASILRALGNSRSPLIAMIVAAVINVGLDLLFVAGFGWGVAGAAIATVTAQAFSALYCFVVLRKIDAVKISRGDFSGDGRLVGQLLKLGAPLEFQNVIISVGGLAVQYVVNGYGFLFVAGFTATNKLYGVLELAAISYGYAITTYVGQNLGAGNVPRIREGVRKGGFMAVATALVIGAVMIVAGRSVLSLFVSGEPDQVSQVLDIAYRYLLIMSSFLVVLYLLYVYRSAIQGLGNTVLPLLSGAVEFLMRVGVALLLPRLVGQNGIFYAEICAWSGAALMLCISYFQLIRRYRLPERKTEETV